jgi:hypothetical protein
MLQTLRSRCRPIVTLALVAVFALLLLLAVPGARPARADTRTGHDFTYYDDAGHSNVVGYRYWCIGYNGGWGTTSAYVEINDFPCN